MYYSNIIYGRNIVTKSTTCKNDDSVIGWKNILVSEMKKPLLVIVCNTSDIQKNKNKIIINRHKYVGSKPNSHSSEKDVGSGFILLSLCVHNRKKVATGCNWGPAEFKLIKISKNNICTKKSNHHDSNGYYYSQGIKAALKRQEIYQWVSMHVRNIKVKHTNLLSVMKNKLMQQCAAQDLVIGVDGLCNKFCNLRKNISPLYRLYGYYKMIKAI